MKVARHDLPDAAARRGATTGSMTARRHPRRASTGLLRARVPGLSQAEPAAQARLYRLWPWPRRRRAHGRGSSTSGARSGLFLAALGPGWERYGIDASEYALDESAQGTFPRRSWLRRARARLRFLAPSTSFTAFDVLEHVWALGALVASITGALARDGSFVFVVPVYDGPTGPLVRALDRDRTHVHKESRAFWLDLAPAELEAVDWWGIYRYLLPGGYYVAPGDTTLAALRTGDRVPDAPEALREVAAMRLTARTSVSGISSCGRSACTRHSSCRPGRSGETKPTAPPRLASVLVRHLGVARARLVSCRLCRAAAPLVRSSLERKRHGPARLRPRDRNAARRHVLGRGPAARLPATRRARACGRRPLVVTEGDAPPSRVGLAFWCGPSRCAAELRRAGTRRLARPPPRPCSPSSSSIPARLRRALLPGRGLVARAAARALSCPGPPRPCRLSPMRASRADARVADVVHYRVDWLSPQRSRQGARDDLILVARAWTGVVAWGLRPRRAPLRGSRSTAPSVAALALPIQVAFLEAAGAPPFPRYFLPAVALLALGVGTRARGAQRALRTAAALVILLASAWPAWSWGQVRRTNVDQVARALGGRAQPADLVVVSPGSSIRASSATTAAGALDHDPELPRDPMTRYLWVKRAMREDDSGDGARAPRERAPRAAARSGT